MAGAGITIVVDDAAVGRALKKLRRFVTGDLTPTMDAIGARLENSTLRRFETQTGPGGEKWKPSLRAKRQKGQTLTDSGRLRASITRNVRESGDAVEVGTNVAYAGIHQFGGRTRPRTIRPRRRKALWWPGLPHPVASVRHPGSKVPARPFLGVSRGDEARIIEIIVERIKRAWR